MGFSSDQHLKTYVKLMSHDACMEEVDRVLDLKVVGESRLHNPVNYVLATPDLHSGTQGY